MGSKSSKTKQSSEAEDSKTHQIPIDHNQHQLETDTTDIPYSVQCQYLIHGYIKSIASKYSDYKYIPDALKTLCLIFYGDKLVDTVIVSANGDINCDILKQHLFPNGSMNRAKYKEFDDKQRFELYKLLLITKCELSGSYTFKSVLEFNATKVLLATSSHPANGNIFVAKYNAFYPQNMYFPDLQPIMKFVVELIGPESDDEYTKFRLYSSLLNIIFPLYFVVHDQNLQQRLQTEANVFWTGQKTFFGTNHNVFWYNQNQCRIGKTAGYCLIDECMRILHPKLFKQLWNQWRIRAADYAADIGAFTVYITQNDVEKKAIRDYLFLYGVGWIVLFQVACISFVEQKILQMEEPNTFKILMAMRPKGDIGFNQILERVKSIKVVLTENTPVLLKEIVDHVTDLDVAINVIKKYWWSTFQRV